MLLLEILAVLLVFSERVPPLQGCRHQALTLTGEAPLALP
jgi:hypothetical protein